MHCSIFTVQVINQSLIYAFVRNLSYSVNYCDKMFSGFHLSSLPLGTRNSFQNSMRYVF